MAMGIVDKSSQLAPNLMIFGLAAQPCTNGNRHPLIPLKGNTRTCDDLRRITEENVMREARHAVAEGRNMAV